MSEGVDRDVKVGGDFDETGGEHWAKGADDGGAEADDHEDHFFLPGRFYQGGGEGWIGRITIVATAHVSMISATSVGETHVQRIIRAI